MIININDVVRVRLTKHGLFLLESLHNGTDDIDEYAPPDIDEEGYTEFQLWELMATFGSYMYAGCHLPFETNILTTYTKEQE
jgi:hypothetical protein